MVSVSSLTSDPIDALEDFSLFSDLELLLLQLANTRFMATITAPNFGFTKRCFRFRLVGWTEIINATLPTPSRKPFSTISEHLSLSARVCTASTDQTLGEIVLLQTASIRQHDRLAVCSTEGLKCPGTSRSLIGLFEPVEWLHSLMSR